MNLLKFLKLSAATLFSNLSCMCILQCCCSKVALLDCNGLANVSEVLNTPLKNLLESEAIGNPLKNILDGVRGYWQPSEKFRRGCWQLLRKA
jgi:hypothetical protein